MPPKFQKQRVIHYDWPRLKRIIRLGIKSLWLHRLRSLLTVLGIVFGVCSVIAMLAIGEGASFAAQEQIKSLGSQNIILRSVKPPEEQKVSEGARASFIIDFGLKYSDVARIQSTIPGVSVVVPGRVIRDYAWNVGNRVDCEVLGTVPWYPSMRNHAVIQGRFFTELEMTNKESVCVIGAEMVSKLFPLESAVGSHVRVGENYFKVIGIMAPRSRNAALGENAGSNAGGNAAPIYRMFIPLDTARTQYGEVLFRRRTGSIEYEKVELHEVTVKVAALDQVEEVSRTIGHFLAQSHKKKDYEVVVPLELLKQAERTKHIFSIVLGSIAAISLLVGGIGIMNIMLASVTERTREIGIRRALGAKRRDIVVQFLVETVMLSAAGGIMGVMLGLAIPFAVTLFSDLVTIVTLWSPIIAFTISACVGIVFGIYPAFRAANMDPVEALRHE